jgi:iron complex transport system ATP-binding protein
VSAALELAGVTVRASGKTLLNQVTLTLADGELVALVGPNGAGKTTLLRAVLGLVPVHAGEIRVRGKLTRQLPPRARAAELGWLPQEPLRPEPVLVSEAVTAARYRFQETAVLARAGAQRALERVDMAARASDRLSELSGGERQRVAIAALLAQEARVLLLDEPANHLDPAQQAETYALIGSVLETGTAVVCVTHDVNLLTHVEGSPRVVGLKNGKIALETRYEAADLPAHLQSLFDVPMQALEAGGRRLIVPLPRSNAGETP